MTLAATPVTRPRRTVRSLVVAIASLSAVAGWSVHGGPGVASAAGAVAVPGPQLVSTNPDDKAPVATDGEVRAIAEVGNRIIVGGTFTTIRNGGTTTNVARSYLFAYDKTTNLIDPGFAPTFNGSVDALQAGADGASVYVGGTFTNVNGVAQTGLVRIDTTTGATITAFNAKLNGRVSDLAMVGNRLYAIGFFGKSRTVTLGGLGAFDTTTGVADTRLLLPLATTRTGYGVRTIDVNSAATRMVIGGNLTSVGGVARDQIAVIDLATSPATVRADWNTSWLAFTDRSRTVSTITTYIRDVDLSDDGSYFVVGTTWYYPGNGDSLSRWEVGAAGADIAPTWARFTGGDTITKLTIAPNGVIYIGGHFRWYNSRPEDLSGPTAGAVTLFGLGAIDSSNGMPYQWAPTRQRGYGVLAMLVTSSGDLLIGHDTTSVAGETHQRFAKFPLAGGRTSVKLTAPTLPIGVTVVNGSATLRAFDGAAVTSSVAVSMPSGITSGVAIGDRMLAITTSLGLSVYESNGAGSWVLSERVAAYGLDPASVRGLTYSGNRLYYLLNGDQNLYARAVNPDSLAISPVAQVVSGPSTGDGRSYGSCNGLFVASETMYAACGGNLVATALTSLGVAGSPSTTISTPGASWNGAIVGAAAATTGTARTNLALGKTTNQSGTDYSGVSSRAVDGNRNGEYGANSVTHTTNAANSWWEVDLGSVQNISGVRIWNRVDCCVERLSNYWVYVSDVPFTSTSPSATRAQAGVSWFRVNGVSPRSIEIPFNRTARYIRIQAPGLEADYGLYLSLAEVEVYAG